MLSLARGSRLSKSKPGEACNHNPFTTNPLFFLMVKLNMWPLGVCLLSFPLCVSVSPHSNISPNKDKSIQIFQDEAPKAYYSKFNPLNIWFLWFPPQRQDRYTHQEENWSLKPIQWPWGQGSCGHTALTFIFLDLVPRERMEWSAGATAPSGARTHMG